MIIAALILAYLFVGFIATMSPLGAYAYDETDLPPLLFMLAWPLTVPALLIISALFVVNDWLEDLLR